MKMVFRFGILAVLLAVSIEGHHGRGGRRDEGYPSGFFSSGFSSTAATGGLSLGKGGSASDVKSFSESGSEPYGPGYYDGRVAGIDFGLDDGSGKYRSVQKGGSISYGKSYGGRFHGKIHGGSGKAGVFFGGGYGAPIDVPFAGATGARFHGSHGFGPPGFEPEPRLQSGLGKPWDDLLDGHKFSGYGSPEWHGRPVGNVGPGGHWAGAEGGYGEGTGHVYGGSSLAGNNGGLGSGVGYGSKYSAGPSASGTAGIGLGGAGFGSGFNIGIGGPGGTNFGGTGLTAGLRQKPAQSGAEHGGGFGVASGGFESASSSIQSAGNLGVNAGTSFNSNNGGYGAGLGVHTITGTFGHGSGTDRNIGIGGQGETNFGGPSLHGGFNFRPEKNGYAIGKGPGLEGGFHGVNAGVSFNGNTGGHGTTYGASSLSTGSGFEGSNGGIGLGGGFGGIQNGGNHALNAGANFNGNTGGHGATYGTSSLSTGSGFEGSNVGIGLGGGSGGIQNGGNHALNAGASFNGNSGGFGAGLDVHSTANSGAATESSGLNLGSGLEGNNGGIGLEGGSGLNTGIAVPGGANIEEAGFIGGLSGKPEQNSNEYGGSSGIISGGVSEIGIASPHKKVESGLSDIQSTGKLVINGGTSFTSNSGGIEGGFVQTRPGSDSGAHFSLNAGGLGLDSSVKGNNGFGDGSNIGAQQFLGGLNILRPLKKGQENVGGAGLEIGGNFNTGLSGSHKNLASSLSEIQGSGAGLAGNVGAELGAQTGAGASASTGLGSGFEGNFGSIGLGGGEQGPGLNFGNIGAKIEQPGLIEDIRLKPAQKLPAHIATFGEIGGSGSGLFDIQSAGNHDTKAGTSFESDTGILGAGPGVHTGADASVLGLGSSVEENSGGCGSDETELLEGVSITPGQKEIAGPEKTLETDLGDIQGHKNHKINAGISVDTATGATGAGLGSGLNANNGGHVLGGPVLTGLTTGIDGTSATNIGGTGLLGGFNLIPGQIGAEPLGGSGLNNGGIIDIGSTISPFGVGFGDIHSSAIDGINAGSSLDGISNGFGTGQGFNAAVNEFNLGSGLGGSLGGIGLGVTESPGLIGGPIGTNIGSFGLFGGLSPSAEKNGLVGSSSLEQGGALKIAIAGPHKNIEAESIGVEATLDGGRTHNKHHGKNGNRKKVLCADFDQTINIRADGISVCGTGNNGGANGVGFGSLEQLGVGGLGLPGLEGGVLMGTFNGDIGFGEAVGSLNGGLTGGQGLEGFGESGFDRSIGLIGGSEVLKGAVEGGIESLGGFGGFQSGLENGFVGGQGQLGLGGFGGTGVQGGIGLNAASGDSKVISIDGKGSQSRSGGGGGENGGVLEIIAKGGQTQFGDTETRLQGGINGGVITENIGTLEAASTSTTAPTSSSYDSKAKHRR